MNLEVLDLLSSPAILVTFFGIVLVPLLFYFLRDTQLPGTLKRTGAFVHPDVTDDNLMEERKRDFFRCAKSKEGILTSIDGDMQPLFKEAPKTYDDAVEVLQSWLKTNEIEIDPLQIIPQLAVTPGFDFLMQNSVPPITKQDIYILIGGPKCVRIQWNVFLTDHPMPNQIAGPFYLKLTSENLLEKNGLATHYDYAVTSNTHSSMKNVLDRERTALAKLGRSSRKDLDKE